MASDMVKVPKNKKKYAGTTCCVPICRSNSVKNPELSFPVDLSLKELWLDLLGIQT